MLVFLGMRRYHYDMSDLLVGVVLNLFDVVGGTATARLSIKPLVKEARLRHLDSKSCVSLSVGEVCFHSKEIERMVLER